MYDIPDGVNPKTRRTYLSEALENYGGFNDAIDLEKLFKLKKINVRTFLCHNIGVERIEDVWYEQIEEFIINPDYPMLNRLKS